MSKLFELKSVLPESFGMNLVKFFLILTFVTLTFARKLSEDEEEKILKQYEVRT